MYMCVKLPLEDLNPGPCPQHSTSTYTCEVIIASKMCGGGSKSLTIIPWIEMNNGVNRKLLESNLHRNFFPNCQLATLISPLFSRMLFSSFFCWIEMDREGDLSFFWMLSSSSQSRKKCIWLFEIKINTFHGK